MSTTSLFTTQAYQRQRLASIIFVLKCRTNWRFNRYS